MSARPPILLHRTDFVCPAQAMLRSFVPSEVGAVHHAIAYVRKSPQPSYYCRLLSTKPTTQRDYYYHVTPHGDLHLASTYPRSKLTAYKDPRFLDFFFKHLRYIQPLSSSATVSRRKHLFPNAVKLWKFGYFWASLCGPEVNYVKMVGTGNKSHQRYLWQDGDENCLEMMVEQMEGEENVEFENPVVFTDLVEKNGDLYLKYAGTLLYPFSPSRLHISTVTGRLYHNSPLSLIIPPELTSSYVTAANPELPQTNRSNSMMASSGQHLIVTNISQLEQQSDNRLSSLPFPPVPRPHISLIKSELVMKKFWDRIDMDRRTLDWGGQTYEMGQVGE